MQEQFADYRVLLKILKENDEIGRKFFEIQTIILATLSFEDFFSKLLGAIREKFGVPYVWLSLVHPSKVTTLVNRPAQSEFIKHITKDELIAIVGTGNRPVLMNSNLDRVSCLLPERSTFDFESIAITPIMLDGDLIGSFNQADPSPERFHSGLDPMFLAQLGLIVSICFSNVAAHEELQILAYNDSLTGLLNRRAMEPFLRRELARAKRYGTPLSLVFVDLDDFKPVNDRFGHDRGDEMLIYVAAAFKELSRESDIIARFAGDEFVLILPGISRAEALFFMERLKNYFDKHPLLFGDSEVRARFSYGIASGREAENAEGLLKMADTELYVAKGNRSLSGSR
ncbi:MAG: sensor domain-containing diguanylate cyclase [Syntrophales bacterium]|nr:sensor domain-containing diguanylate cyclase [Syntrophales bacterium]